MSDSALPLDSIHDVCDMLFTYVVQWYSIQTAPLEDKLMNRIFWDIGKRMFHNKCVIHERSVRSPCYKHDKGQVTRLCNNNISPRQSRLIQANKPE